jgi:hypothetical protein
VGLDNLVPAALPINSIVLPVSSHGDVPQEQSCDCFFHTDAMAERTDDLMRTDWFPPSIPVAERTPFNDATIHNIAVVLRNTDHEKWSKIPRTYIVLRTIGQSHLIDTFANEGLTDLCFPFSSQTLPRCLVDQATRDAFLAAQHLVLTKSLEIRIEAGGHDHFQDPSDLPFTQLSELGRGGFGVVHKVLSNISYKEYAIKSLNRGRTFRKDANVLGGIPEGDCYHEAAVTPPHRPTGR